MISFTCSKLVAIPKPIMASTIVILVDLSLGSGVNKILVDEATRFVLPLAPEQKSDKSVASQSVFFFLLYTVTVVNGSS